MRNGKSRGRSEETIDDEQHGDDEEKDTDLSECIRALVETPLKAICSRRYLQLNLM